MPALPQREQLLEIEKFRVGCEDGGPNSGPLFLSRTTRRWNVRVAGRSSLQPTSARIKGPVIGTSGETWIMVRLVGRLHPCMVGGPDPLKVICVRDAHALRSPRDNTDMVSHEHLVEALCGNFQRRASSFVSMTS
jgi:hypothetical protein